MKKFPARIHVLMAREANYAVVIRRGPSEHVCTVGWDLSEDTFTLGQWLKGSIDARMSDLSPDGKHLIYFAKHAEFSADIKGIWTAISIAPYLKPLGLWKRTNTWGGGGRFISNVKYWINKDGFGQMCTKKPDGFKESWFGPYWEFFRKGLCREKWEGWSYKEKRHEGNDQVLFFEKDINKNWVIVKKQYSGFVSCHSEGKGCVYNTYELFNRKTKHTQSFPNWEWAEARKSRLYWAERGKIYRGTADDEGLCDVKELYDFNGMTFEPIEAPY